MHQIKSNLIKLCCLVLLLTLVSGWINPSNVFAASQVRITEIMYDPSGDGSKEFIEFYNGSDTSVTMSGWSTFGVDYVFPSGTSLAPSSYIVIARNKAALQASHPGARIIGQYAGKLKGSGELIRLSNSSGSTISQVSYSYGGAWPSAPRNGGPSLSLIRPQANETLAACWGSSTASGGSPGYTNSSTGGGSCSNVAYPVTPEPVASPSTAASTPSSSANKTTPTSSSTPAAVAKKQAEEQKKQEQVKIAEAVAKAQEVKAAEDKAATTQKITKQKEQKWAIVYISMGILAVGGGLALLVARYLRKKNAGLVLKKGNKQNNVSKSKPARN